KLIIFVLFTTYLFSNTFEVNKKIDNFSLVDQFDKKHTVKNDIKIIIVSFEKGTGADINEFLSKKPSDFLVTNQAVFIADISGMPSIITSMFALPKMRKYKHTILLIYDEEDKRFIQKNDYSTLYKLDDGVIKSISYIKKEDLKKVF
ncbi:hypothetical protein GA417_13295, partial [Poseidonibacter ostreae]